MEQYKERETIRYKDLKFKQESWMKVGDMENNFITEELLKIPLYKKIEIDDKLPSYKFFPYNDVRVESYCNKCKQRRIFSFENSRLAHVEFGPSTEENRVGKILENVDYFTLRAMADCGHELLVCLRKIDENKVMKIGQDPSIYDIDENINNKSFLKLLDEDYVSYYKKACSLYSFDTCIGAMVYLRRIFEKLLIDTFNINKENISINEEEFKKKRVEEKVRILKEYLPEILQEEGVNRIYTKISNGIHNLSENECQTIFTILKEAIEEILIEKIHTEERKERISEISKNLLNI